MANIYPSQTRTVDPYASYNSNVVNRLTRMISNDTDCLFSTHAIEATIDTTATCAVIVSTGQCFKDDTLIEFTSNHTVDFTDADFYVDTVGGFFNEAGYYYVVLDYEYVKAQNPPQASLKIIPPSKRLTHYTSRHLFLKAVKLTGVGPNYTIESVHDYDPENTDNTRIYSPLFAGAENTLPTFDQNLHEGKIVYVRDTGALFWGMHGRWEEFQAIRDRANTTSCSAGMVGYLDSTSEVQPAIATSNMTLGDCIVLESGSASNGTGQVRLAGKVDDVLVETGINIEIGHRLYLSASEAGKITNLAPASYSQYLGRAISASSGGKVSMWFVPWSEGGSDDTSGFETKYDKYQDLLQASIFLRITYDTFGNLDYVDTSNTTSNIDVVNREMDGTVGQKFYSTNLTDVGYSGTSIGACQITADIDVDANVDWYVTNDGTSTIHWEPTDLNVVHRFSTIQLPITADTGFSVGELLTGQSSGVTSVIKAVYPTYLLLGELSGGSVYTNGETIEGSESSASTTVSSSQIERTNCTDLRVRADFTGTASIEDYAVLYELGNGVGYLSNLEDQDGDTSIDVEASSNENKIRMTTGGTEMVVIDDDSVETSGGLRMGFTARVRPGMMRSTGYDYQGWDGTGWVSFISGGGGGGSTIWSSLGGGDIGYNSGNIGMGTLDLSSLVDIGDTNKSVILTLKRIDGSISTSDELGRIKFVGTHGATEASPADGAAITSTSESSWGSQNTGALRFWTADSVSGTLIERMTIDSAGYIGIGEDDPQAKVDIKDDDQVIISSVGASSGNYDHTTLILGRSKGTLAAPSALTSGNSVSLIASMIYDGVAYSIPSYIQTFCTENMAVGSHGSKIVFGTTENGTAPAFPPVRMIIDHNGNVGIGDFSSISPDSTANLHVLGNIKADGGTVYADAFSGNSPLILEEDGYEVARIENNRFLIGATSDGSVPAKLRVQYSEDDLGTENGCLIGLDTTSTITNNSSDLIGGNLYVSDYIESGIVKLISTGGKFETDISGPGTQYLAIGGHSKVQAVDGANVIYGVGHKVEVDVSGGQGISGLMGLWVESPVGPLTAPNSRLSIYQAGSAPNLLQAQTVIGPNSVSDSTSQLYVIGSATITGSVEIGSSGIEDPGIIEFDGTNFRGYNGTEWVYLDSTGVQQIEVAGSDREVQFNDGGNLGASSNFSFDSDNNLRLFKSGSTGERQVRFVNDAYSVLVEAEYYGTNQNFGGQYRVNHARGTEDSPSQTATNDKLGYYTFGGYTVQGNMKDLSYITATATEAPNEATGRGSTMEFFTILTGATTFGRRMYIGGDGKLYLNGETTGINDFVTSITDSDDVVPTGAAVYAHTNDSSIHIDWTEVGNGDIHYDSGNVGIGIAPDSTAILHVNGDLKTDGVVYANAYDSNSPLVLRENGVEIFRSDNGQIVMNGSVSISGNLTSDGTSPVIVRSEDIDHTLIQNRGTNTHSDIDAHIANTSIHGGSDSTSLGLIKPIRTITSDYNVSTEDYTILANGTSQTVTATLPDATTNEGHIYIIKAINIDNQVDIDTNGGTIDGEASYIFTSINVSLMVQSNGINYYII